MLNGGSMIWGFCVYFVYMIPLETDVLRKHRFQKEGKVISKVKYSYCLSLGIFFGVLRGRLSAPVPMEIR